MNLPNVRKFRNEEIFPSSIKNLDTVNFGIIPEDILQEFKWIRGNTDISIEVISIILVGDFRNSEKGLELATKFIKEIININSEKGNQTMRLAILDTVSNDESQIESLPNLSFEYTLNHLEKSRIDESFDVGVGATRSTQLLEYIGSGGNENEYYIIINGRKIGPLENIPDSNILKLLIQFEYDLRISQVLNGITEFAIANNR
jgi:hypothetical protein